MRDRPLIAIVDDDASVCRALNRLIRSARMDAETFNSARDFLDAGESHEPDCLILDVQMPGMTGLELRDQLSGRGNRVPVIFITAHEDVDVSDSASVRGVVAFVRKPFSDQLLLAVVAEALKGRGTRKVT
jgi:FixJ family two-component response regulator